jgi:stress-induced morphogen
MQNQPVTCPYTGDACGGFLCCRVEIVSQEFEGKRLVQRHQIMYKLLDDEIKAGVHALSMDTKTPKEAGLQEQ